MKTYTEFVQLNNTQQDAIEEDLRSTAGAYLTLRSRSISTKIKQIIIHQNDSQFAANEKLSRKIDLLSEQLLTSTYTIAQLGIMK